MIKRFLVFVLLIMIVSGVFMTSKVTFTEISSIETEIKNLAGKKIIVGVVADENSLLAKYAAANEFGADIKPKNGKYLSIPLQPEFKGKSPKDYPDGMFDFVKSRNGTSARLMMGNVACFLLVKHVRIPERAFIRTTLDTKETQDKAIALARAALERILGGGGRAEDVANAIGLSLVSSIKTNISANLGPANSQITQRLKGEDKTLIDSADLLKSIGYLVEG